MSRKSSALRKEPLLEWTECDWLPPALALHPSHIFWHRLYDLYATGDVLHQPFPSLRSFFIFVGDTSRVMPDLFQLAEKGYFIHDHFEPTVCER